MTDDVFVFPLSYAQERLWFFEQLVPGNPFYNMSAALSLSGELDLHALERSLNDIVRRHEVLRTIFSQLEDGSPVQVVHPPTPLRIDLRDLSVLEPDELEDEVKRQASSEALLPFDLKRGPLLRVVLLKLSPREHVLLVAMHHIVSDGWSLGIFTREFTELYRFNRGEGGGWRNRCYSTRITQSGSGII